jgi:serine/threonine protein kinase
MPLHAGDKLGSYEILARLGAGGMGAVWKARDPKLGRMVAIKVLKDEEHDDLTRLVQEARAAAQLNHPNIVTIHEIGEQDGRVFVVMEFIDGRVLNEFVGKTLGVPSKLLAPSAGTVQREALSQSGQSPPGESPQT